MLRAVAGGWGIMRRRLLTFDAGHPRRHTVPISVALDHAARRVQFTIDGPLDTAEMFSALDDAFGQMDGKGGYDVLSDHRELSAPATPEQIKQLMSRLRTGAQVFAGRKVAIVVVTEASYGMIRLLSAHAEQIGIDVRAFRDMPAALECLDAR